MTDQLDTPIVIVRRWTRYGKDRGYVSLGELQIGYRDLHSGDVVCDSDVHRDLVERATEDLWRAARAKRYEPRHAEPTGIHSSAPITARVVAPARAPQSAPTSPPVAAPAPSRALLPDRDLRHNEPGAAVRAQAQALRDAAPVRTRVERFLGVKSDERAWRIGGDAEKAVADRLARLGAEWLVLHAIPVGDNGSDIDHLVIGPAGVFTVNAKNHPNANVWVRGNTVKVNGQNTHYVRNSRHEAARAAKLLSARALFDVEVRGVVAIMGMERGFTVKEQPADGAVTIVQRKRVGDHLASLPTVLGRASIERIHDVARHLATWQPKTVAWSPDL